MMVIENKYNIGDYVKLITDVDEKPRIITEIRILSKVGLLVYELSCGTETSNHYDFEIEPVNVFIDKINE